MMDVSCTVFDYTKYHPIKVSRNPPGTPGLCRGGFFLRGEVSQKPLEG